MASQDNRTVSFESLPPEDVLFIHIFPRLDARDWLSLLNTSKSLCYITQNFLAVNKILSIAHISSINPTTFRKLTTNATNLRTLNLSRCSWVTDQLLRPILRNNNRLTSTDLSFCDGLTEGFLQILSVQCPNISCLNLRECKWVAPDALDYMAYHRQLKEQEREEPVTEDILQAMGKGLRTNLKLRTKSKYRGKEKLYNDLRCKNFKAKSRSCLPKMQMLEVDISGCEMVQDTNIDNFVKVFKNLQIFKLGDNCNITDISMKSIATNLKDLHTLDISCCLKISNAGLFTVAKYCKKLENVDIGKVQFPTYLLSYLQDKNISIKKSNFYTRSSPTLRKSAGPSDDDLIEEIVLGMDFEEEEQM